MEYYWKNFPPINSYFHKMIISGSEHDITEMIDTDPSILKGVDYCGNTPLHIAIQTCVPKLIELMLSKYDKSLSIKNLEGDTPLLMAVRHKRNHIVELLLEYCPSMTDEENVNGDTAVSKAVNPVYEINDDVLWKMLKQSQAHDKLYYHGTLLHRLLYHKRDQVAVRLIQETNHLNIVNQDGDTVLHHAIRYRYSEPSIALMIIDRSKDVTVRNNDGATPLHMAVCTLQHTVVRKLLEKMTDANLPNIRGEIALHYAVLRPDLPHAFHVLQKTNPVLYSDREGLTPMHFVMRQLDPRRVCTTSLFYSLYRPLAIKMMERIIQNKELATKTEYGSELFSMAVGCEDPLLAKMMLPEILQVEGNGILSPIHILMDRVALKDTHPGFISLCDTVFEKLENLCVRDSCNNTLLHVAVANNLEKFVREILKRRPDSTEMVNDKLQTPLHVASYYCTEEVIWKALLQSYQNVNQQDIFHYTALHYSIYNYNPELTKALLEKEADVDLENAESMTALQQVIFFKREELLPKMLKLTKNINQQTITGDGLLHLALTRDNLSYFYRRLC